MVASSVTGNTSLAERVHTSTAFNSKDSPYLGIPTINSQLILTHIQLDVELGEDDQECHLILCGPGLDPQIAHGFDQQARRSSLDTHWAVYGVGDFQGHLSPKLRSLSTR